jgi:hypothetical protein
LGAQQKSESKYILSQIPQTCLPAGRVTQKQAELSAVISENLSPRGNLSCALLILRIQPSEIIP